MFIQSFEILKKKAAAHESYFRTSKEEITKNNLRILKLGSVLTFLLILLFIIVTPIFFRSWVVSPCYWIFLSVMFVGALLTHVVFINNSNKDKIYMSCILFCSVVITFLIIIDTVLNPKATANFFPIVFVVLPVVFVLRYSHILTFSLIFESIYIIFVSVFEKGLIRQNDIYNSLISLVLTLTVSYIILSVRVEDNSAKQRYKKLSKIDYLTSIYNKNTCERAVSNYFANRPVNSVSALIIMDIDNFKTVNDKYGHTMGDRILEDFSRCLIEVFGDKNIVGRFGGDEFMVLLGDITEESAVPIKCRELQNKVRKINYINDYIVQCSIGAAIIKNFRCGYFQMLKLADDALYEAKKSGKNRFVLRHFNGEQTFGDINPSIALIDFDDVERINLRNTLCKLYEVKEAGNDNDAANALEYLNDRLSGVILDFYSKKIDSLAILKYIKTNFEGTEIPVIAIVPSNHNDDQILKLGVSEVIQRPIDEVELIERLQNVITNNLRN